MTTGTQQAFEVNSILAEEVAVQGDLLTTKSTYTITTAGDTTITAQQLAGYTIISTTQTNPSILTTDTATNILAQFPNASIGSSFKTRIFNNDQSILGYTITLAAGSGITLESLIPNPSIPKGFYVDYLFVFTAIGSTPTINIYPIGGGEMQPTSNAIQQNIFAGGAATLTASQVVGSMVLTTNVTLATNMAGAVGYCSTVSTNNTTFTMYHIPAGTNVQTAIGVATFPASGTTPSFATNSGATLTFSVGDVLQLLAPSTVDPTLAGIAISIPVNPTVNVMSVGGGASTLPANSVVLTYCCTVAGEIPANFNGSVAACTNSATASATFNIYHITGGTNIQQHIGTLIFQAGALTGSFSAIAGASLSFNVGDVLQVLAPSTVDSSLGNICLSIVGVN